MPSISRPSLLTIASSLAIALATASAAVPAAAGTGNPTIREVTLQVAAVFGAVEAGTELPDDLGALQGGIEEALQDWDLEADFTELRRVLRLSELRELMRWSSTSRGPTGAVTTRLSDVWRLELSYEIGEEEVFQFDMKLFRDAELVSAPRIRTVLGERAVLSTAHEDGTFLFFFIEAEASRQTP